MRKIGLNDIDNIALGASLLGAGGGGDPYIGKLMAMNAVREHGPVTLIDHTEVADDALILPIGMMGAPTVLAEKGIGVNEIPALYEMACRIYGRRPDALMCTEAGGVNSMMPLCAGAVLGIPVVDADGMGRAFPELQMETMTIGGISASPVLLVDEKGNRAVFETIDNSWTEELARACTIRCGGNVCVCMYAMDGKKFRRYSVHGTISRCMELGSLIRGIQNSMDKEAEFLAAGKALRLFRGKILDVMRSTDGAFSFGCVTIEGSGEYTGHSCRVSFRNENILAEADGHILATVPDLICLVDTETYYPVTTDALRYGKRVMVIAMPCHPLWQTDKGLKLVGPGYFGIDADYIPVKERIQAYAGSHPAESPGGAV